MEPSPYTEGDLRRAVNTAACLGWSAFCLPMFLKNPFALPWLAVFGLPVAFGACWMIGSPILRLLMKRSISWLSAGLWGAAIAALIAALSIVIGRYHGYKISLNPNFHSQVGGGDFVRSVDGTLTSYGWWVLVLNTAQFVLLGAVIGLVVRWRIGAGNPKGTNREV